MKLYSSISTGVLSVLLLSGCASSKTLNAQKLFITAQNVPLKNGEITEAEMLRWSHLDIVKDTIPGMSVDRAYAELLVNKTSQKVIVAVIDSGTDIEHPDLKGKIWINKNEIPNNGIDDDNNGYIDDINGWNFLGNNNNENLEMTRILKSTDDGSANYKRAKEAFDNKYKEALGNKQQLDFIVGVVDVLSKHLNKNNYTLEEVEAIETTDATLSRNKLIMLQILSENTKEEFDKEIDGFKEYVYEQLNYHLNKDFNGRINTGENPNNMDGKFYGNNIVWGVNKKDALHGTHVAGIIAQIRGNNIGGDGVASNVEIMAIKAVPNGDEYDKDIALAIRYAADNGAKIINGSFGKGFSPNKEWVYEAIKYAANKDVLFVHAAGNDGENIDITESYPNDRVGDKEIANNFIKIGALNYEYGSKTVATFSNYGKIDVDVFAPGVKIYATTPNNEYKYEQGTSMASPNAAGVAALVRSYFPDLKAHQIKQILKESGVTITKEVEVNGDADNKIPFANLSTTGKIINAYNAILMAESISKKIKK